MMFSAAMNDNSWLMCLSITYTQTHTPAHAADDDTMLTVDYQYNNLTSLSVMKCHHAHMYVHNL